MSHQDSHKRAYENWPGMVVHACNPSTLGDQGGQITWNQEFKISLVNMAKPHLYQKYKNQPSGEAHACKPSYLEGWGERILWTRKAEVAVSRDRATALQPGAWWQSKTVSKKNGVLYNNLSLKEKNASYTHTNTHTNIYAYGKIYILVKFAWI